jgi:glycosyltransferase involved in cell wall biosynthesis
LYKKTEKQIKDYILKNGVPDLIHSHALFMGGVIGMNLSKKLRIPQFHTEHTSGLIFQPEQYTKSDIHLLKEVYTHCKKVFFVSEFAKNKITQAFELKNENFAIIHNVVDSMFFNSIPQTINSPSKFLVVGNIIPRKNHVLLINAWKMYSSIHTDSTLTIAGEGENLIELIALAEELKINQSINWFGKQNRMEVKQLINEHHVVLSTSKLETFGLTVAEAIASGKPVVVTDSGGVKDIINTSNGIITGQSVESFCSGLLTMKKNFDKYNSQKNQEEAKLKFSEEAIYTILKAYY